MTFSFTPSDCLGTPLPLPQSLYGGMCAGITTKFSCVDRLPKFPWQWCSTGVLCALAPLSVNKISINKTENTWQSLYSSIKLSTLYTCSLFQVFIFLETKQKWRKNMQWKPGEGNRERELLLPWCYNTLNSHATYTSGYCILATGNSTLKKKFAGKT